MTRSTPRGDLNDQHGRRIATTTAGMPASMPASKPASTPGNRSTAPTATTGGDAAAQLTKADYERLAQVRHALRRFARSTELETRRVGASPQQYLLLLAIKGYPNRDMANITELAERLQVRHNAVIGLVNRAVENDLVTRRPDPEGVDRRVVFVALTPKGEQLLQVMAESLRGERERVAEALTAVHGTVY